MLSSDLEVFTGCLNEFPIKAYGKECHKLLENFFLKKSTTYSYKNSGKS